MSRITINRLHQLSHKRAREVAEDLARDLQDKFNLRYQWKGDRLAFTRPGVEGHMKVGDAELELYVELGLLLAAWKTSIEKEIHKHLDDILLAEATVPAKTEKGGRTTAVASARKSGARASSTAAKSTKTRKA